ncbi:MAG: type III pantothenate kinase [Lachnospiraceae bacterium]|nr:type III pantothenate kinase [Candidatus Darwinimomas equi]
MILGIDIGNTNIVIGGINNAELVFSERAGTDEKNIRELFSRISGRAFEGAILSSVVPSINLPVIHAVRNTLGVEPIVVSPDMTMNIHIPKKVRKEIGSDIIVGLAAAANEYPLPLAVVDMGTASTVFALDKQSRITGGAIHPGIVIEFNALSRKTAQLPEIQDIEIPERVLGQDTDSCIKSGVIYGHAGMVDAILSGMEKEMNTSLTVIATGGLGRFVAPICSHKIIYDEALLIKGLDFLYKINS